MGGLRILDGVVFVGNEKKHLNIHLEKDVFRCPRCGFSGGVFDLYAYYAGIDRKKARETLYARLNLDDSNGRKDPPPRRSFPVQPIQECPITDVDTRHETYTALLSKLSLASDHRNNLLGRGLSNSGFQFGKPRLIQFHAGIPTKIRDHVVLCF